MTDIKINEENNLGSVVQSLSLIERTGAKSGKKYKALELVLTNGYKRLLFLDQAELYMIEGLLGLEQE